ncbi:MAG: NADH-quinone oxidoreductase subunit C/D [Thermoleophilia bacterium]
MGATVQENGADLELLRELRERFPGAGFAAEPAGQSPPTIWAPPEILPEVLRHLKSGAAQTYATLYDLTAVDERLRRHRPDQPAGDFTLAYHLLSLERNRELRVKTALAGEKPHTASIVDIWPAANWYEREAWDMFGITFDGHPHLRRILMPPTWEGHPLRKEHPARATEMPPFQLPDAREVQEEEALKFRPEDWGIKRTHDDTDFLFLNVGPQHPGTHGLLRIVLELDGEVIVDAMPDIGFHHRGAEKMGERQTWHTYIPYTDRIDYLGGVLNNLPYVMAVERLAGIEVPERAQVIRVMLAELFRIASHLVWYGTFAQDVGTMSPVFYMFTDRERLFDIIAAICGDRMHPNWFRIGGVAQDLPRGWEELVRDFIAYLPARLKEYDRIVMQNRIFKGRTKGVGAYSLADAIEWGVTGPGLRACGLAWDLRKRRPYSGYDQFEFEIPTAATGDCYDRAQVRVAEIYQSLRIVEQCVDNMPAGPCKADHPLTTPPPRERTLHDIETLITHFLQAGWGPVMPPGEATAAVEGAKGINSYYLISDGGATPYRVRIRAPSFPHLQMIPLISRGSMIPDLLAILGSMDYVLADVDR